MGSCRAQYVDQRSLRRAERAAFPAVKTCSRRLQQPRESPYKGRMSSDDAIAHVIDDTGVTATRLVRIAGGYTNADEICIRPGGVLDFAGTLLANSQGPTFPQPD